MPSSVPIFFLFWLLFSPWFPSNYLMSTNFFLRENTSQLITSEQFFWQICSILSLEGQRKQWKSLGFALRTLPIHVHSERTGQFLSFSSQLGPPTLDMNSTLIPFKEFTEWQILKIVALFVRPTLKLNKKANLTTLKLFVSWLPCFFTNFHCSFLPSV